MLGLYNLKYFSMLLKKGLCRIGALVEHCKVHYSFYSIFVLLHLEIYHNINWYFWCPMTIGMYEWTLSGVESNTYYCSCFIIHALKNLV